MAGVHDVLLLWFDILGLCLPPLFFVSEHVRTLSLTNDSYHHSASLAYSFSQQKKQHALQPHARRILIREP